MGPHREVVDDLATLAELDDSKLLEHLEQRYQADGIYTYIGDILISVNPYKDLPRLYGEEIGKTYGKAKTLHELRPHVYALASCAFHSVQRRQGNQCILVSGESGAGKTEITKMLVAQVARLSQWSGEHLLQDKIVEVNPLLEAFGNACTVMNNNSSRFGKLIEMIFSDSGSLLGAKITEHMLEKSRVVQQGPEEKNFHIFYNILCGFSHEEQQRYFLEEPETYRIVDPGHGVAVVTNEMEFTCHKEGMNHLRRIMPLIGFTDQDMDNVFALLSAILHFCNIEMAVEPESDDVIVMNEIEVDLVATLLSVTAEDLMTVLLSNVNWIRGERIVYVKSLYQATDGRDALAKALYSRLFSWVVQQINFMLHEDERWVGDKFEICILDMAGFENFQVNSFEQLCINAANERLQHYFNEHIFTMELEEYQLEGIKPPKIKYTSNSELLSLLFQRQLGLFSILEEECVLAKTTDMSFVEKLNKQYAKHTLYVKSKHRDPIFGISHYAGLVTYSAVRFLEKNRDTLSFNMQSLLEQSQNSLINELFSSAVNNTGTLDLKHNSGRNHLQQPQLIKPGKRNFAPGDSLSRQAGRKIRQKMKEQNAFEDIPVSQNPNSTSAHFKNSLKSLMDRLARCEPQFIRCIKPNHLKSPNTFDSKLVLDQLRSTGVLETIKIRKLGFAVRLPFPVFMARYHFIAFPLTRFVEPGAGSCTAVLNHIQMKNVVIGKTKVFLRYWQSDYLNAIMDTFMEKVVKVQSRIRTYMVRKSFLYQMQMAKRDEIERSTFCIHIQHHGNQIFQNMMLQAEHNSARSTRERLDDRNGYSGYHEGDRDQGRIMIDDFSPNAIDSTQGFYYHTLSQVIAKYDELDPDIWCKILYMEYHVPVAKFYICEKTVTFDGSLDEFDGRRIGLGFFPNRRRHEITEDIRSHIGKGLQLHRESDGSISATRLSKNEVIAKGYKDPQNHCLSADVIVNMGQLPFEKPIKVFDMEEYKSHIAIELRQNYNEDRLKMLSIFGISLLEDCTEDLKTPCWLCIVNIHALNTLRNPNVKQEMQQKFLQLTLQNEEKKQEQQKLQSIAGKYQRNFSKMNIRKSSNNQKEPLRKTRIQIKQMGGDVKDNMTYSWMEEGKHRQKNIMELQEELDETASYFPASPTGTPGSQQNPRPPNLSSTRKDWAKIKFTIKEQKTQEGENILKSKSAIQE